MTVKTRIDTLGNVQKSERPQASRKRGAPPKAQRVSTREILSEAVGIVTQSGPNALSIRGLADRIGISPMAVYNHFSSKDELLGAVIDELITTIPADYANADNWVDSLRCFAGTIRSVALESPDWIQILVQTRTTPLGLDRMEKAIRTLQEKGLSSSQSVAAYTAIYGFAFGHACLESSRVRLYGKDQDSYWAPNFTSFSEARYPVLSASATELSRASAAGEFELALDRLLNSLVSEFSASPDSLST
jgi:AcrR family transcriptional regulator